MDKIKELLKQLGGSAELVESVIKEFQAYKERVDKEANETLVARLEKAKQICLEELNKEKADLARKVEIFLEARIASINREAQKRAAIGESEAVKTLKELKNLLEGVNNDGNSEDNQAETKKLRLMAARLQEEITGLQGQAKRANTIAMRALQRNKVLESQAGDIKPVAEEKPEPKPEPEKPKSEEKEPEKKEGLEAIREESEEPKTTRHVLVESQTPAAKEEPTSSPDIMAIADGLDGSPAFHQSGQ